MKNQQAMLNSRTFQIKPIKEFVILDDTLLRLQDVDLLKMSDKANDQLDAQLYALTGLTKALNKGDKNE